MKRTSKTIFTCQSCGYQTPKWLGKCPDCEQWHSFVEEIQSSRQGKDSKGTILHPEPVPIDSIPVENEYRLSTGVNELDRVLGGGLVPGTLVLIGGDPGIGKSTLMLQALDGIACTGKKSLYISGEESVRQLRIRSERLTTVSNNMLVVSEIDVEAILNMMEAEKPAAVVVDSIQTLFNAELTSAPGSVSQVRESAVQLMLSAKKTGIPIFLVGHVTKDGAIAGPRLL